jgi:glycosyltransferase involved in cell wall biosynthesis
MINPTIAPDYIFESNWEVCNKVGGIYTVLSTRAKTLQRLFPDKIFFIGPDLRPGGVSDSDFIEDRSLLSAWKKQAVEEEQLRVRVGRWDVPGRPIVVLIDFSSYYHQKDAIYYRMWEQYGIDSTVAYGDYDDSSMFAYGVGVVIESLYRFLQLQGKAVVAHLNEWMMGMAVLYLRDRAPEVATVFTTHATSTGRSICGNGKPLYGELGRYDGDQMARELHVEGKHGLEKAAARLADCFTTVSRITARESEQLLGKRPDVVTPNGFEPDFVPKGEDFDRRRTAARQVFRQVAEQLTGRAVATDALLVATSGRYEYRNKGLDVFIEALNRVRQVQPARPVVAFMLIPAYIGGPRKELQERLGRKELPECPLTDPYYTHELMEYATDPVCNYLRYLNFTNREAEAVRIIFVPSYLNGDDGIFNLPYYDLLTGLDLTVFPSYYEPWGYTPLESIAFHVPTITTQLAGFGLWAQEKEDRNGAQGVEIVERTDTNYFEAAEAIKDAIVRCSEADAEQVREKREAAYRLSKEADWAHFIRYYSEAYAIALNKKQLRNE